MILMSMILDDSNMGTALKFLRDKHDGCGVDGLLLSQLNEYWNMNKESLKRKILKGEYNPEII